MKHKIFHCITSLAPDGAQNMLLKLAQNLNEEKFEYEIVSMTAGGSLDESFKALGMTVHNLGMSAGIPNPLGILRLAKLIKSSNPDFLLGWMYHANLVLYAAARLAGCKQPLYWNIRRALDDRDCDKAQSKLVIKLNAYFSKNVSRIIYCGEKVAKHHEAIGFAESKRLVILNGFDTSAFKPFSEAKQRLKAELGIDSSNLIVGTVGRFHPQKDHATLIRAAGSIKRTDVHFVLVGRDLTPDNKLLASLIKEYNLSGSVHLLGQRSDVKTLVPGFDLFCLSSVNEGFPNVVGEAMACGVPCVSTDAGVSAEVVGDTGRVVPRRNPQLLAEAIESMISLPQTERDLLGVRARRRVEDLFEIKKISKLYEDEYERAINKN